tara:strand:- start:5694 stop:6482 length:789 start_codon:yes stop_codon:yes gene_type:complete
MKNTHKVQIFDYVHTGAQKTSVFQIIINFVIGACAIVFLITLLLGIGYLVNTSSTEYLVQEGVSLLKKSEQLESPEIQKEYIQKAFEKFLKAAKKDNVIAQYFIGTALTSENEVNSPFDQDISAGITWLEKSAAGDYVEAMVSLAELYFTNEEYRDLDKGYSWSLKAAGQDNGRAMFFLHLLTGDSTEKFYDLDESLKWLTKAAGTEDPDAMFSLAIRHFGALKSGEGNPIELVQKINNLLIKASDKGHEKATQMLEALQDN